MDFVKNGRFKRQILQIVRNVTNSKNKTFDVTPEHGEVNPAFSLENVKEENHQEVATENDIKIADLNEETEIQNDAQNTSSSNLERSKQHSKSNQELSNDILVDTSLSEAFEKKRKSAFNSSVRSNYELSTKSPSTLKAGRLALLDEKYSMLEEPPDLNWTTGNGEAAGARREMPELRRSEYSLVSCTDVTPGALNVWSELPDQVKYDPSFATFRERYERQKDNAPEPRENSSTSTIFRQSENSHQPASRIPLVNSAPHLGGQETASSVALNRDHVSFGVPNDVTREKEISGEVEHSPSEEALSTLNKVLKYTKLICLLSCWIFFTLVFMLYEEKESVVRHSSVAPGEVKDLFINMTWNYPRLFVYVELNGPFYTEQTEEIRNTSENRGFVMQVWLETRGYRDGSPTPDVLTSDTWRILMRDSNEIDFSETVERTTVLSVREAIPERRTQPHQYLIRFSTDANVTAPFTISYKIDPLNETIGVASALMLLFGLYVLIIFEIINRTLAAVLVSSCALGVLGLIGERPSLQEMISWLDVETLLLLFSMMLLVAITAETGLFDYLAVFTFSVTKGKMWPLINLLCFFTAFLSTFLDNVTTVLLMTPVTIRLCELMELNPIPILMAMVIYSNIGGTATPVGDPPNVIIASNQEVVDSGINFGNFTLHMTVGILLVSVQTYFQLRFMYKDVNKLQLGVPKEIQEIRQQIGVWRRAAGSLPTHSKDEEIVRIALERKVAKLERRLKEVTRQRNKRTVAAESFQDMLSSMKEKYNIRDRALLVKSAIAIGFVVVVFFLHSIPELQRISLGWTALLGAILLLVLAEREDLEHVLSRVEWSTLLFFAALFVLMEALSKLGLIQWIGGLTESLILQVHESGRLAVAIVLILWVSGIASAFVDNIPLTTMMVRVATSLGNNPALGLPMAPLIWSLSFGACLGGNGTLIGASANVVTAGVAEQHGYRITFTEFFKVGFPLMLGHLLVATVYLMVCHCLFTWH